jgi:acetamidase/formamidase
VIRALLLLVVCLSAGCASLNVKKPTAAVTGMAIKGINVSAFTMAFDVDLDDCVTTAIRDMLALMVARTKLDRYQAYALMNLAADLRITQVANGTKGAHCRMHKKYFER